LRLQHILQLDDGGLMIALGLILARGTIRSVGSSRLHPLNETAADTASSAKPALNFETCSCGTPLLIFSSLLLAQAEPVQQVIERRATDAEKIGRLRQIAVHARHRAHHLAALGALARLAQVQRLASSSW
jgi:hypothetical protein